MSQKSVSWVVVIIDGMFLTCSINFFLFLFTGDGLHGRFVAGLAPCQVAASRQAMTLVVAISPSSNPLVKMALNPCLIFQFLYDIYLVPVQFFILCTCLLLLLPCLLCLLLPCPTFCISLMFPHVCFVFT